MTRMRRPSNDDQDRPGHDESAGVLPGHKLGRRWIFLHDELELGLRHAPSRNGPRTHQQPPARQAAGPPPSGTLERYPHASSLLSRPCLADDTKRFYRLFFVWAVLGSNQRPPACKAGGQPPIAARCDGFNGINTSKPDAFQVEG
jgi:hypothetical protein